MKFILLIPVYLARPKKEGWREGDAIYDHPTAIDEKGTLVRTLESLECLSHEEFDTALIVSTVHPELENRVEEWLNKRRKEASFLPKQLWFFTHRNLFDFSLSFGERRERFLEFFEMRGYPQGRNIGLLSAQMFFADAAVWLDDDELIRDKNFFQKLREGFSQTLEGQKIRLITGACPEGETGDLFRVREVKPWMKYWDKVSCQNKVFQQMIAPRPRWKKTPMAHGGLSAIHRDVFQKIPYDPYVYRGEDMDYNMNARMFGMTFFWDNTLEIRHLPPRRSHPKWRSVREDILRFLWQRKKIREENLRPGMKKISAEEFDPYPGYFLKDNLEELIEKSQKMLSEQYFSEGKTEDAQEALFNVSLPHNFPNSKLNAFEEYVRLQKLWEELMEYTARIDGKKFITPL